jgi:catechol 2,3-dioxygenase-like lactoylglutathione lyase family enzyme
MSYVALLTRRFDDVTRFYGEALGFPIVEEWDRSNARGRRFDTGGMRLEIIDNEREQRPLELGEPGEKLHIVVEVDDIDEARKRIKVEVPPTQDTSWGTRLFQIRDPDDVRVTFLQWTKTESEGS